MQETSRPKGSDWLFLSHFTAGLIDHDDHDFVDLDHDFVDLDHDFDDLDHDFVDLDHDFVVLDHDFDALVDLDDAFDDLDDFYDLDNQDALDDHDGLVDHDDPHQHPGGGVGPAAGPPCERRARDRALREEVPPAPPVQSGNYHHHKGALHLT